MSAEAQSRWIGSAVAMMMAVALLSACARTHAPKPPVQAWLFAAGSIEAADTLLASRMSVIARRSPAWRAGLDSIRTGGFRVVVARPDQARRILADLARYDAEHFGEVVPLRDRSGAIIGAVVAVDVQRLLELYEGTELPRATLEQDVDRILIHEIYGHVVPLAATRRISGGCPDPAPGAPASSSCAITRENRIRRDLGLEPRRTYDIRGLAIGRALHSPGRPAANARLNP